MAGRFLWRAQADGSLTQPLGVGKIRRIANVKQKSNYQDGLQSIFDPVIASWQAVWVEDCKKKGKTIPFSEWCFVPLIDGDPMSSPFEIANVYVPEVDRS
jgi:hypothetical protein